MAYGRDPKAELAMMQHPDRWPLWPMLPLKRFGRMPDTAVLLAIDQYYPPNGPITLFVGMHAMVWLGPKHVLDTADRQSYDSLQAVVDDGWRVD